MVNYDTADSTSGNDKANPVLWFATGDHPDGLLHSPVLENFRRAFFACQSNPAPGSPRVV